MTRALLALAVVLVLPASTEAAPLWSAPRDVSSLHTFVDGLWAGGGLIGWRSEDGEAGAPAGRVGDPVFFTGGAAVAIEKPVGSSRDASSRAAGRAALRRALRRRPSGWPSTRGSRRPRWPATGAATSRSRGSRTAARATTASTSRCSRKGHAFGKPIRLATGRVRSVSAAIGTHGDVLVAWDARGKIRTRFMRHGHGFGTRADAALRPDLLRHPAHRGRGLRVAPTWRGRRSSSARAAVGGAASTKSRPAVPAPRASAAARRARADPRRAAASAASTCR